MLYFTEQLPLVSVQSVGVKVPLTFAAKCTVPEGSIGDPVSESVTVTVQAVPCPGKINDGEQTTETVTDLDVAVTPIVVALP